MLLHGYWRSSAAWRCRIAFNLKNIEPDFVSHHLTRDGGEHKSPEFLAVNPQAMVPALEVDGRVLTQSLAILEWLEETVPKPPLLPDDPFRRARVRAFAQVIACDIHPLQNLRVLQYLRGELQLEEDSVSAWLSRWIGDGLQACESLLTDESTEFRFAFGDQPMLADVCLAPQLYSAARFNVDLANMPRLRELGAQYARHAAFVSAHAANQPDSEA